MAKQADMQTKSNFITQQVSLNGFKNTKYTYTDGWHLFVTVQYSFETRLAKVMKDSGIAEECNYCCRILPHNLFTQKHSSILMSASWMLNINAFHTCPIEAWETAGFHSSQALQQLASLINTASTKAEALNGEMSFSSIRGEVKYRENSALAEKKKLL